MFEDLCRSLPENPVLGGIVLIDKFLSTGNVTSSYSALVEAYTCVLTYLRLHGLFDKVVSAEMRQGENLKDRDPILRWLQQARGNLAAKCENELADYGARSYGSFFDRQAPYEFVESDLTRVQQLITELRELIAKTNELEEGHKERLLMRLEALQREMHRRMSSLDRCWGFIIEAGLVLGQFGENVKPLTDRIVEMAKVFRRAQVSSEVFPTGRQLPPAVSGALEGAEE